MTIWYTKNLSFPNWCIYVHIICIIQIVLIFSSHQYLLSLHALVFFYKFLHLLVPSIYSIAISHFRDIFHSFIEVSRYTKKLHICNVHNLMSWDVCISRDSTPRINVHIAVTSQIPGPCFCGESTYRNVRPTGLTDFWAHSSVLLTVGEVQGPPLDLTHLV